MGTKGLGEGALTFEVVGERTLVEDDGLHQGVGVVSQPAYDQPIGLCRLANGEVRRYLVRRFRAFSATRDLCGNSSPEQRFGKGNSLCPLTQGFSEGEDESRKLAVCRWNSVAV